MKIDYDCLVPLLPQPQTIVLGADEEQAIASSLDIETAGIQEHLSRSDSRQPDWHTGVRFPGPGAESFRLNAEQSAGGAEVSSRQSLAERLTAAFLRHPIKIIDLEDVSRVLREGLRSRRYRGCETILDFLKGHENSIHLGCGLPYSCRFNPALDLKRGKPKAILLFWGEALWNRPDFAIYPTDTGVLFRENNFFSGWITRMNSRYPRIYGTQMHPSRLAIDAMASSPEILSRTRVRMAGIYLKTRLDLRQARRHLTSLLANYFPFTGSDSGWLSEVWVEPRFLPEAVVSHFISPRAIKALLCLDGDVPLVRHDVTRAQISMVSIAARQEMPPRIQFSEVIHSYAVAVGAERSLARYINWLTSCRRRDDQ
jgi:hypothetical protein